MSKEKQAYDENRDFAVKSRRRVLEKEIDSLKTLMYGGSIRIWPYMSDIWGDYSEEQTRAFVHQVIDEEHYQRMHSSDHARHMHKLSFYEKLLYCVFRTLTADYTDYRAGNTVSFEKPEKVTFSSVAYSFQDASDEFLELSTVTMMQALYEILTRKEIDLAPLNQEFVDMEITDEMLKQMMEEADSREAVEDILAKEQGVTTEELQEMREEEQKELEAQQTRRAKEQKRVRDTFPEKESFCRDLEDMLQYVKEYPVKAVEAGREIRELLFQFLSDRRLTVLDEEEAFVEVMVQLKKTIRTAQSYLEG